VWLCTTQVCLEMIYFSCRRRSRAGNAAEDLNTIWRSHMRRNFSFDLSLNKVAMPRNDKQYASSRSESMSPIRGEADPWADFGSNVNAAVRIIHRTPPTATNDPKKKSKKKKDSGISQTYAISRDETSGNSKELENLSAIAPQAEPDVPKAQVSVFAMLFCCELYKVALLYRKELTC